MVVHLLRRADDAVDELDRADEVVVLEGLADLLARPLASRRDRPVLALDLFRR